MQVSESAGVLTYPGLGQRGRLGNQLFQIAATVGLARASGAQIRFPPWKYAWAFSVPGSWFGHLSGQETDARLLVDPLHNPVAVEHLQIPGLWAGMEDEIRVMLAPSAAARRLADRVELPVPAGGADSIAVHVRRGDFLRFPDQFPVLPIDYYVRAFELAGPGPVAVFSDDPLWCGQVLVSRRDGVHVVPPAHEIAHLVLMSRFPRQIIANSTFSWWGAYLSGSEQVIGPRTWFGPGIPYDGSQLRISGWTFC
ncbi:alpha-1,2-fucosyltransferase [Kribbella sp. NPDC004536]|uniref:alpha-1,2-fucosyltransferase n=1 Tax=Kribbella sp. NPDC004536 TaxID=3364106 RepID=UPI0036B132A8